jgi:hypothetical protein
MSSERGDFRARCIRIATFLGGLYFFVYFITPQRIVSEIGLDRLDEPISNGLSIVGTMAFGLGLINIVSAHGARLAFRRVGWFYSLALLFGLVSTIVITAAQWRESLETSRMIRDVQIIGEFSARIKKDAGHSTAAEAHAGAAEWAVPALPIRTEALASYATTQLTKIRATLASEVATERRDAGMGQLASDLRGDLDRLERLIAELRGARAGITEMTAAITDLLDRISKDTASVASTYALVIRADRSNAISQRLYDLLYNGLFNQLGSAMFALLGVYIAAAAYRAFRIRSLESALMMGAALVVMLGQISFGRMISDDLPQFRQWLLEVPNSAAFRAIRLGAGVAGLMLAIRMWLSIESSSFSSERKKS